MPKVMGQAPVIDISECSYCESCVELCPSVFRINEETGIIEAVELSEYPEEEVREAISCCPRDCIIWEKGDERAHSQAEGSQSPWIRGA